MRVPSVLRLGPLGRRLLFAIVAVALIAVTLVVLPAVGTIRTETAGLQAGERERAERAIVAALATAYTRAGSWERADLTAARALARAAGLQVVVLNATGAPVAGLPGPAGPVSPDPTRTRSRTPTTGTTPGGSSGSTGATGTPGGTSTATPGTGSHSPSRSSSGSGNRAGQGLAEAARGTAVGEVAQVATLGEVARGAADSGAARATAAGDAADGSDPGSGAVPAGRAAPSPGLPIVVAGAVVGRALIDPAPAAPDPAGAAARAMVGTVAVAVVVAVLLATLAALAVTRIITRPVVALGAAARAVERADPAASALLRDGPGELGEVSRVFARMAATLQREDELRRAMAADVAHELRTPVTILRGVSEEVLDGLAEPGLDMVRSFHEEVLRLERIVDDLATLSSAEAAGLSLRRDRVDLAGVAEQAVGQLRHRFQEAGQDVEVILTGPRELLAVDGDEIRLGQVVTNLLTNATAVTPRGGRIEVAVAREAGEVRLTVTDSGPGIPPEERERVFERFFRGRGAGDRPGSGIGLAVVAELVRVHGGQVRAGGPPGRGAVFTVTLPAG